ncbi:hypothetical protein TanjilG_04414 [Lupinus angustifolius]|uniref:Avr9/Cf-9 rapidly elicited protein n=1 Tax=Lupinus angustifolius TaxID=3871 RepID=A0A4P1RQ43_LUPAN|nr:PREDICTED: uncharacterized protein LOC109342874 isoform X2 [Lupinus angustifolius]OIW15879.1 hypothetical protein TanjilG_04414 [Lupinus angustifolius]
MENNVPIITKRVWNMLRVVLFMFRKGISKRKLMMNLNFILKRPGKLAGKAIANLMFHHHHHNHGGCSTSSRHDSNLQFSTQREYEFSCSNTPNHFFPIGGKHHRNHDHFYTYYHAPPTVDDDTVMVNTVKAVLEVLNSNNSEVMVEPSNSTPVLEKNHMVRQLRVAESPLLLGGADNMVDKKAEEFIKRFYKELRKQD